MKKKILITGSTGFIGKNLLKMLPNDHEIYCLSRKNFKNKKINFIKANIFNLKKINILIKKIKPDYLIHLAWEAEPQKYLHKKINIKWAQASTNLFYNFCKNNGKKAVLIGSILENNLSDNYFYEREINLKKKLDQNLYNISKIKFYNNAKKIKKKFRSNFVWVRIPWLYGPFEKKQRLIPKLIYCLKNNRKIWIQNPNNSINILHVEDIVNVIYLLLFSKINGVFNLVNSKTNKIIDVVSLLIKIMKKKNNKVFYNDSNNNLLNFKTENKKIKKIRYKFKYNLKNGLKSLI